MVALDATTLSILSSWQIPQSTMNADSDWGNSPILFNDATGRALVAGINKNGFLYAFLRSNIAAGPVWYDQVAISGICPTCGDGSVSSMAFAQGLLYAAGGNTTINGVGYPGAVRAVDPATGTIVWARGLAEPRRPRPRIRQRDGLRRSRPVPRGARRRHRDRSRQLPDGRGHVLGPERLERHGLHGLRRRDGLRLRARRPDDTSGRRRLPDRLDMPGRRQPHARPAARP